jgi:hypothetical protein
MATTTVTFSLRSSDLIPSQVLSMTTSKRLYKAGSALDGVNQMDMGRVEVPTDDYGGGAAKAYDLIDATALAVNKSNYIYIANLTTTESNYVVVSCKDHVIGRLYAGDFMWLPCNFDAATNDIDVQAFVGTATLEYAVFHEGKTLTETDA